MTSLADQVVDALHDGADQLAPLVQGLSGADLRAPSGAAEWDVSQVLSHLGSGAVITLSGLDAALAGEPRQGREANEAVWDRWNAMSPQERRDEFLVANAALLARYDSLGAPARESLRVDLGFLPAPVDLGVAARFRLNEFTLHSWDVRVAFDPAAVLHPSAVPLLLEQVDLMLGRLARPEQAGVAAARIEVGLTDVDRRLALVLDGSARLAEPSAAPDAVLRLPAEAWLRLVSGRLSAEHTPQSVELTGEIDPPTLRRVFPGY